VVDRDSGTVTRIPAANFFTFHVVNSFADGDAVVDLVAYDDATIVDALSLDTLETEGYAGVPSGRLVRYRIDVGGAESEGAGGELVTREPLYDGIELPTVPRAVRRRDYRYAYGQATAREGANGLVKVDVRDGTATEWWEDGVYVEEPRMVQRPDGAANREDDGVVIAPALSVDAGRSMLLVFDAATLEELARAELPHHLPFGFHGRFFPR
jgi:carotenoid cleavage dioxygenase-like enzyme